MTHSYKRPFWQWIVLFILIIVIISGVIFSFLSQKKQLSHSQNTHQPVISNATRTTVTLNENGFSPDRLTITAGNTVVWINKSGQIATVNSDPHPTHTNYPPLNLGQFSSGQMLLLKFPKKGIYGYHNHLDPSQHGTIVVE